MQSNREFPAVHQIRQLPADLTMTVPPEWEDINGHVNVQHYLTLYNLGGWKMLENIGFDENYIIEKKASIFDLEHHLRYLAEINVGDEVSVYNRTLNYNDKLFQGMFFIVNDTHDKLASTIEYLALHVDMKQRRSIAFSTEITTKLLELRTQHEAMDWASPVSGLMNL